jgi:hypothetical protein
MDETALLNDALAQAGGCSSITAIDDGSHEANQCQIFYPALRDGLLRAHFWNFAVKWVELAQDTPAPTIGYAYSYTIPPDFLRLKDYAGASPSSASVVPYTLQNLGFQYLPNYKIESGKLRTNDGQAFLQYIWRVENVALWDPMFYQAVASFLGAKLALAIRKDPKQALALTQQGESLMLMAMSIDGQEGSTDRFIVDDLIWGRY